jgi:hypothetical protein
MDGCAYLLSAVKVAWVRLSFDDIWIHLIVLPFDGRRMDVYDMAFQSVVMIYNEPVGSQAGIDNAV